MNKLSVVAAMAAMFGFGKTHEKNNYQKPTQKQAKLGSRNELMKYHRDYIHGTMSRRIARNVAMGRHKYA